MPLPGPPVKQTREELEARNRYTPPARGAAVVSSSRARSPARGAAGVSSSRARSPARGAAAVSSSRARSPARRPVRESRLRVESILYNDPEEVIKAIEELARSSPDMRLLPYGTLRDILIARGKIGSASGAQAVSGKPRKLKKSQVEAIRMDPETLLQSLLSEPLSRKESQACEREMISARHRAALHADRADEELAYYRDERRLIKRRVEELELEIDNITLKLGKLANKSPTKQKEEYIEVKRQLYALERLQKQEELMRHQDRLLEINEIMKTILRKYEDKRTLDDIRTGGTRTRRHKWSLKYKRSINCKHPKGFSQKQHCKYGRKNRTSKK